MAAQDSVSHFCAPGHSARELDRLSLQARMYEAFTRQLFHEAGLLPGIRVLDVGCGSGDVALLASEFVGPTGEIVGIDRAASAIVILTLRKPLPGVMPGGKPCMNKKARQIEVHQSGASLPSRA